MREKIELERREENRQRQLIGRELAGVASLDEERKQLLEECYVQKNTVFTTALKLNLSETEVRMWYYRLSMCCLRAALREAEGIA